MVKCQVVSFAKGNVAIVFPFGEFFLGAEFFGGAGEGEGAKHSFPFSMHAFTDLAACFPKVTSPFSGGTASEQGTPSPDPT